MQVVNVHRRHLSLDGPSAGALIDSLASGATDTLWPWEHWPAMRFDGPLRSGALGGHGPVRYHVERYEPGRLVRFRFLRPRGFHGWHGFEVQETSGGCVLRHELRMRLTGFARLTWPLFFRPLHDALIEDALDKVERPTGQAPTTAWSQWVRTLRWLARPSRVFSDRMRHDASRLL